MRIPKIALHFLLVGLLSIEGFCQVPQAINYQAVARDNNGIALAGKSLRARVSILQGAATGQIEYQETHDVITDNAGAFSIKVGLGTPTVGTFRQIDWANGEKFVKSEFDFNDGTGFQLTGTSQILSVPFALYAGNSSNQWKITHNGANYSMARLWEGDSSKFPLDNYSQIVSVHSNAFGYPISTYNTNPAGMSAIAHWIEETNGLSAGWLLSGIHGVNNTGTSWGIPNAKTSNILGRGGDFILGPVTSNKSLFLLGGGSPQAVIGGNGNVGIGNFTSISPNAKLQIQNGDIYLENIGNGVIMKSPSGQCWRINIDDSGNLIRTAITCP